MTIRTKWHRLAELIDAEEVYFTAATKSALHVVEPKCPPHSQFGLKLDALREFYRAIEGTPKFVIDPELLALAKDKEYHRSMLDMKRAGVLRLPYPAMVVEFSTDPQDNHYVVLVRDLGARDRGLFPWEDRETLDARLAKHEGTSFYVAVTQIKHDRDGDYLVLSPSVIYLGIKESDEIELKISASSIGIIPDSRALNDHVGATYIKDAAAGWRALFAALLLMATGGVEREVIECEKLNRRRVASSKPPIPRHTYVHIGRVYRSAEGDASDPYVPGKSKRPHWRRGHLRGVRYGEGKQLIRAHYFPARLVAYHGGPEPAKPNYVVKQ